MRHVVGIALLVLVALAGATHAQQTTLEVITLNYRNAEQVIPVLKPLLAPHGTITGLNDRLVVRTTPENLAELKQVLATIDAAPRRLLISVRQDAELDRSRRGGQVSGQVDIGDNATVRMPGRPTPPGATVRADGVRAKVYSSESASTDRVSQQVQVIEGGRALIRVGQSVPMRSREVIDTPGGRRVLDASDYRDVDTGFYVVPRVAGDRVTLEISTAADTLQSGQRGAVDVQRVQAVVTGRLGEWIELGGLGQQSLQRDSEILGRSSDARRDDRRVLVKVDEIR
jgi:type II secretory pathway component GspD/PulD (secretin)